MSSSPSPRLGRFQLSLKSLFAITLVAAAFFAGWGISERRAAKRIDEAQEAAQRSRRQEDEARRELQREAPPIPCHPGCFPAGTLVRVPRGTRQIEQIHEGDDVVTVGTDGKPATAKVVSVFITRNRLLKLDTDAGTLETTQTQPVCLARGDLRPAGELRRGDVILRWDGTARQAATVRKLTDTRHAQVFNLVLGDPTIFIAGDFLVRSKPPAASPR